jgi:hypothetical protein
MNNPQFVKAFKESHVILLGIGGAGIPAMLSFVLEAENKST